MVEEIVTGYEEGLVGEGGKVNLKILREDFELSVKKFFNLFRIDKTFSKGGKGSGVKGHKRETPDIKRLDTDFAGMEIQQVRRKLLNYYAPGEIRDMESKNGEKSLRARLQSAVTGKPVSFKKMAKELKKGGTGSGIRGHRTEKRVDFSSPNQKTMEDFMQKEKVPFDEDYTVRIGSDYYRIKTEGWFPDCMESRGYEDTSIQSIRKEYLDIMTQESNRNADIHGYMPDYPGTEFGVSYIGVKLNIEKAMTAEAMSGEPGYVPMPEVYDGMGKPIKTKKNEKKIFDLVAAMYKEIQEEVNEEWDKLFGKGVIEQDKEKVFFDTYESLFGGMK
jgi:hypothetical protein